MTDRDNDNLINRKQQGLAYKRSPLGLISTIYQSQKLSSKRRGHKLPEYTRKELVAWMLSQDVFSELYGTWVSSNYNPDLKPSVDRLKNSDHYRFENIQITTWIENNKKGYIERTPWIGRRKSKIIIQLTIDKVIIKLHLSAWHAGKNTSIDRCSITKCCKGINKSAGGFKWEYKNMTAPIGEGAARSY